jgi:hypothetical protein
MYQSDNDRYIAEYAFKPRLTICAKFPTRK